MSNKPIKIQKHEKVCGSRTDPCRTIQKAVTIAEKNSDITIMASELPYQGCPVEVQKPLAFKGANGKPVIDCAGKDAVIFNFPKNLKNQSNIKLEVSKLRIQNCKTGFSFVKSSSNVILRLTDIEFHENEIDVSWKNSHLCHLWMSNVFAVGNSGNAVDIHGCNKTIIELRETTFLGKYFRVISSEKSSIIDIKMDEVTFNMSSRATVSGFKNDVETSPMYVVTALEKSAITVKSSKFLNHFGESQSMFNITAFQKKLKKVKPQYISRININFNNTIFVNNTVNKGVGGATSFYLYNKFTKKQKHVLVFNACTFIDNSALHGGAMWFSQWVKKTVLLNDSTFINNKALGVEDASGGALYGLGGRYLIRYCQFNGNTAIKSGGSLYLSNKQATNMKLSDSIFKNKRSWSRIEGEVLYLNDISTVFTGNVVFDLVSSNAGESIFLFEGRPSVLQMSNSTTFVCPAGYNYEEPKYVLRLSRKRKNLMSAYHIFAFTCQPCQDLYYSTTRGFRQQNGTERRGKCRVCPHGASCNGTIRARANFWGRLVGDQVEMTPCPKGYCCNREPCDSYNTCHSHRVGTLCGHCADGYTEGMNSPKCFPNEKCIKASWLWPIFNVVIIFVILCFHEEVCVVYSD